uniref:GDNF/GAS1 domain-containing protein n=1 Tax=Knipowitschia caucasica TaxID=637954 RepID=A0AAV2LLW9_KNICA
MLPKLSRLADFLSNCEPEARSISGCLRENYADCLLSYSGLVGTVMTPNYVRSQGISLSPWCDCSSSGNNKPDCDKFTQFFTDNRCLRNAIQAFGNGTDVGVWQPQPPIQPTTVDPGRTRTRTRTRTRDQSGNSLDTLTDVTRLDLDADSAFNTCGLQAQKLMSNLSTDSSLCAHHPLVEPSSNAVAHSRSPPRPDSPPAALLLFLLLSLSSSLTLYERLPTM